MENTPTRNDTPIYSPPFTIKTLAETLKIFVVIFLFTAFQGAMHAYTTTVDWSKLFDATEFPHLLIGAKQGFLFALIQGSIRGAEVLLVIWAGPTAWKYVGPIVQSSLDAANNLAGKIAAIFRRRGA